MKVFRSLIYDPSVTATTPYYPRKVTCNCGHDGTILVKGDVTNALVPLCCACIRNIEEFVRQEREMWI